jgi:glycosyltransferase involved in cell wall biosynthesis
MPDAATDDVVTLDDLPPPPPDRTGWPWTETSDPVPETAPDGSDWPKISIVTPSYNQGAFIEETIRSVLLQNYPNLEYIVVDGGSDDQTVEILEKYDPWIDHWISEPDQGQTHAINKGLAQCAGDIFNWVNSDDLFARNALSTVAQAFGTGADPDVVCGFNRRFEDETGETVEYIRLGLAEEPEQSVAQHRFIQTPTFYRMGVLEALGPLDEDLQYNMDKEYFIRYLLRYGQNRISFIDDILAHFRLHEDSKTVAEQVDFQKEKVQVYQHVRKALQDLGEPEVNGQDDKLGYERWYPHAVDRYRTLSEVCVYLSRKNEALNGPRLRTYKLVLQAILNRDKRTASWYRYLLGKILYPRTYRFLRKLVTLNSSD